MSGEPQSAQFNRFEIRDSTTADDIIKERFTKTAGNNIVILLDGAGDADADKKNKFKDGFNKKR